MTLKLETEAEDVMNQLWKMAIVPADYNLEGGPGVFRYAPPTHYTFKIKFFSLLSTSTIERCESCEFEAGGYKWKLILHPNGNKKKQVEDHVSLYLAIVDDDLPLGWEVNASFRFLLFDQIQDKYLALGDWGGVVRRFHGMKTEWGFSNLIPLTVLKDPSNGFLVDDTCVFGAEVFVCRSTGNGEVLSMQKPSTVSHTWIIKGFSKISELYLYSNVFATEDHEWRVCLYPKGYQDKEKASKNSSLSIYLELHESLDDGEKVYVDVVLRLKDQVHGQHMEYKDSVWFDESEITVGELYFIALEEFKDAANGFLVDDACIIEAEVTVTGVVEKF